MATNNMPLGDKIIRKHDYRHFELGVTPVSDGHYEHIRYLYKRIENYFKDRPEVQIDRKIYNDHNFFDYYRSLKTKQKQKRLNSVCSSFS